MLRQREKVKLASNKEITSDVNIASAPNYTSWAGRQGRQYRYALEIHTVVDLKHDKRWAAKCICILGCHSNDQVRVAHNLFRVQRGRSTPNKMSRFQVTGCLAPLLTWLVVPAASFNMFGSMPWEEFFFHGFSA